MIKTISILITSFLLMSCKNDFRNKESEIQFDKVKMELGMTLYKNKIIQYEGNVVRADSAYLKESDNIIIEIYKDSEK